jgi:hypothetical protein
LLFFALFFKKSPQCFPLFFFPSKSTVCGGGHANEAGRERKKKEVGRGEINDEFFLVIYEFAEELQSSASLLRTVAPHHFVEGFVFA